jgi:hypothetical protein
MFIQRQFELRNEELPLTSNQSLGRFWVLLMKLHPSFQPDKRSLNTVYLNNPSIDNQQGHPRVVRRSQKELTLPFFMIV